MSPTFQRNLSLAVALSPIAVAFGCLTPSPPAAAGGNQSSAGDERIAAPGAQASGGGVTRRVNRDKNAVSLAPIPAPPSGNVPRPSASVSAPHLRVLPWAGFKAAITYTFDDTQPSQTEHLSELLATGVRMTFFANPSGNWQPNFDDNWRAVAVAGSEMGNHTYSHCHGDLKDCKAVGSAEDELDRTTSYIITRFGVADVYSFAAPFGDSSWNHYAQSRFLVGRGVQSGLVPASGQRDWYDLPVIGVSAGQTATQFKASIDSARAQGKWGIFLLHSLLPTKNNWYAGVETADVVASISHAKTLADVWIDTMGSIGAYARAQQVFENLLPAGHQWTWNLPEHFPPGRVLRVSVEGGTLSQNGTDLPWDSHGYYEINLDAQSLSWRP